MFARLATLATLALPLVSATLTLNTPTDAKSDPARFNMEMVNGNYNSQSDLANNVQTSEGIITVTLPVMPAGDGYTIDAVDTGNINSVYATTGDLKVAARGFRQIFGVV
ncbi:uncharacterized protein EDB91DRAFT_1247486 [Suillus paluster]|uniref:uncharacterized protein n=1 Tax=Suillus paluster TaxID=48578 RepID=UPI001B865474|nr:uncharacterized protein EDB91DRAFT_1247486 [Suillus paluster]KAG1742674.1 hypothetical protein EDB91DRAFT_1247486 [Suillus paluster]